LLCLFFFFFSSRRRHTIFSRDWSSDVCSSDLLASQLQGGLDGIGAGRAGELQLVLPVARLQQHAIDRFKKILLGRGGHVQAVYYAVGLQVLDDLGLEDGIVVSVVQGARAAEEVDIFPSSFVQQQRAARLIENHRERPDVATDLGLHPVKNIQIHNIFLSSYWFHVSKQLEPSRTRTAPQAPSRQRSKTPAPRRFTPACRPKKAVSPGAPGLGAAR